MKQRTKTICLLLVIAIIMAITPAVAAANTTDYAYIRIEGYDGTLVEKTQVPLNIFSLEKYGVTEDPESYSVLHAIIAAINSAGYDATDTSVLNTNGGSYVSTVLGKTAEDNAGWMYVLNDESSWNGIKDQSLSKDDYVVLYYIEDWMSCSYSTFGMDDEYKVDAFTTVKLNLKNQVTDPVTWATSNENLSGAVITVNGEPTNIVTDSNGDAYLTFTDWGTFDISAEKFIDGINTISRAHASIKVEGRGVAVNIYTKNSSYSAFMDPKGFDLDTYNVASELEFSALHAVIKTLIANNISVTDSSVNNFNGGSYISKLAGIEATGNAGWMYTLNNQTSWNSLNEQPLKDGDLLEVYYLDDWMTDSYAFFNIQSIEVEGGERVALQLSHHVTDSVTWEVTTQPCAGYDILVNGKRTGYATDNNGFVVLTLNEKGVYEISTTGKQQSITYSNAYVTVLSDNLADITDFSDADLVSEEYSTYMAKAVSNRVMSGDQNGLLRPLNSVTKAEYLTMVIRASKLEVFGTYKIKYADVLQNNWFAGYAQTVFKYGLAKHDKASLNPNADVTWEVAQYALQKAFDVSVTDNLFTADMQAVFADGLTREEAAFIIYSFMDVINK